MAFTKKLRSYFFDTFGLNSRGKQTGFKNDDQPNQERFEELMASSPFFLEAGDRAKQESASPEAEPGDIVGHVAVTTDVKAKNNDSGLEADRTLVAHAGQLPSVDATEPQTVGALSDVLLDVTVDAGVPTRNNFLVKLKEAFRSWLNTLRGDVDTNTTNIATNTANILTNSTNITNLQNSDTTINSEGILQAQDNGSNIGTTTKTLDFYSTTTADVVVTDQGSNTTRADFSALSDRVTTAQNGVDGLNATAAESTVWTYVSQPFGTTIRLFQYDNTTLRPAEPGNTYTYTDNEKYYWKIQDDTFFMQIVDANTIATFFAGSTDEIVGLGIVIPNGREAVNPGAPLDGARGGAGEDCTTASALADSKWSHIVQTDATAKFNNGVSTGTTPGQVDNVTMGGGLYVIPLAPLP